LIQEVAALSGDAGSINNGAFDFNTLTVNQATATTYSGTIDGNVRVRKTGFRHPDLHSGDTAG
jgi:hypothetical protein